VVVLRAEFTRMYNTKIVSVSKVKRETLLFFPLFFFNRYAQFLQSIQKKKRYEVKINILSNFRMTCQIAFVAVTMCCLIADSVIAEG